MELVVEVAVEVVAEVVVPMPETVPVTVPMEVVEAVVVPMDDGEFVKLEVKVEWVVAVEVWVVYCIFPGK